MDNQLTGICYKPSPFVTAILSPQLKNKSLPLFTATSKDEYFDHHAEYTLLDSFTASELDKENSTQLSKLLNQFLVSVVLVTDKNYKIRSHYLDIGFTHILELPIATELVIKTIDHNVTKHCKNQQKPFSYSYENHYSPFNYLHDNNGSSYLVAGKKACYLTTPEKGILEYLQKRNGFATKQELAYAGWKHFEVKPNTITVTVKKLRHKIQASKLPYRIKTLYGYGYCLESSFTNFRGDHESH